MPPITTATTNNPGRRARVVGAVVACLALITAAAFFARSLQRTQGWTRAIRDGNATLIGELLDRGTDPNRLVQIAVDSSAPPQMVHPLVFSLQLARVDVVAELLRHGANVNAVDAKGRAALIWAVEADSPQLINLLLDAGASPDTRTGFQKPAVVFALDAGKLAAAETLLDRGANVKLSAPGGSQAIHAAAQIGDVKTIERLLAAGEPVDVEGEAGWPPLMFAAESSRIDAMNALLQHGANWEWSRATTHTTALMRASMTPIGTRGVQRLLEAGADVNAKDWEGMTALHLAVSFGPPETVEVLISQGADLEVRDDEGHTPMDCAARRTKPDARAVLAILARAIRLNSGTK